MKDTERERENITRGLKLKDPLEKAVSRRHKVEDSRKHHLGVSSSLKQHQHMKQKQERLSNQNGS